MKRLNIIRIMQVMVLTMILTSISVVKKKEKKIAKVQTIDHQVFKD